MQLERLCQQNIGLDVNAACGPAGRTALHAAAESGSAAGVRALLGLGADSYCADESGTSPLMLAAAGGHHEAVKVRIPSCCLGSQLCLGGHWPGLGVHVVLWCAVILQLHASAS